MGVDGFLDKKIQSANDKTQVRALLHVRVCYRSTRYRAELSPVLRGWTKLDWLTILLCPCNVAIRTCLLTQMLEKAIADAKVKLDKHVSVIVDAVLPTPPCSPTIA